MDSLSPSLFAPLGADQSCTTSWERRGGKGRRRRRRKETTLLLHGDIIEIAKSIDFWRNRAQMWQSRLLTNIVEKHRLVCVESSVFHMLVYWVRQKISIHPSCRSKSCWCVSLSCTYPMCKQLSCPSLLNRAKCSWIGREKNRKSPSLPPSLLNHFSRSARTAAANHPLFFFGRTNTQSRGGGEKALPYG